MNKSIIFYGIFLLIGVLSACDKIVVDSESSKDSTETPTKNKSDNSASKDSTSNGNVNDSINNTGTESQKNDSTSSGSGQTSSGGGSSKYYSVNDTLTVAQFIKGPIDNQTNIIGYIVGDCISDRHRNLITNFGDTPFTKETYLLLADSKTERDKNKLVALYLKPDALKKRIGLVANPKNLGKRIRTFGTPNTYQGMVSIKPDGLIVFLDN